MRRFLKWLAWSGGGLLSMLVAITALLAFPGFMFAHQVSYANLVAYTDDDRQGELTPVLREIHDRLAASTINATATRHRIFLGHDKPVFGFLQDVRAQFVRYTLGTKPSLTHYRQLYDCVVGQ